MRMMSSMSRLSRCTRTAGKIRPALLVDVARVGHVRRRLGVAAVGLMRLRGGGEHVLPFPEDGHEDDVVGRDGCCRGRGRCAGRRRPPSRSSCRSVTASARNSIPITCTGSPSAEASRRLSAVISAHEKSRAMLSTAERPLRSSVFSISRTIESSRFAMTASSTGSKELMPRPPARRRLPARGRPPSSST